MKRFFIIAMFLLTVISIQAQWKYSKVIVPETTASDSFKVPDNYFFSGLQITSNLDANMDTIRFLVSVDPKKLGWDTLTYSSGIYIEKLPSKYAKAISLKIPASYQWQWWKILFDKAISDSIEIYPQFSKIY